MRGFTGLVGLAVGGWLVYRHLQRAQAEQREDERRDQVLEDSFPASDPPSLGGSD